MKRTARWTSGSLRGLDEIGAHFSDDNLAAASRVVGTPCIVAYRVHADDMEILTIQHGAQPWPEAL